jgi:TraB family protein
MKPIVLSGLALLGASLASQADAQPTPKTQSEEIVVTAQRSGIPVWRVRGNGGTLVLVGTIDEVAKGTNWNPDMLATALRGADQVMFPQDVQYTGGFFAVLGAPGKARKMEPLPRGQTLANYVTPVQYQRLLTLRDRGMLRPGFEARRPLFVAYDLAEAAKGGRPSGGFLTVSRVDWKTDPEGFVRNAIHKYHLRLLPVRRESLNGALERLASAPPATHVPCLLAAANFAEAGPAAFQARSQAWVTRHVRDVVNSPAEHAFTTCAAAVRNAPSDQEIEASLVGALHQPLTTVAVLEVSTLAADGGLLDRLTGAGYEITGPSWK